MKESRSRDGKGKKKGVSASTDVGHIALSINPKGHCFHEKVLGWHRGCGGKWKKKKNLRGGTCRDFDKRDRNENIALDQLNQVVRLSSFISATVVRCLDMHAQTHKKTCQVVLRLLQTTTRKKYDSLRDITFERCKRNMKS